MWNELATPEALEKTTNSLKQKGIKEVLYVPTGKEALKKLQQVIPAGAQVMMGASTTLEQIGFIEYLKSGNHQWRNLRGDLLLEKNPKKQAELRRQSVLSEYWLGSVHAVAETGEIVTASATGSQLPAYAFTSPHLILVVGTQKIVPDLSSAFRRLREYVFPLEDTRMKKEGYPGSSIGKTLILEREPAHGRITVMFIGEKLGF